MNFTEGCEQRAKYASFLKKKSLEVFILLVVIK